MSESNHPRNSKADPGRLPPWLTVSLFLIALAVSWWQISSSPTHTPDSETNERPAPRTDKNTSDETSNAPIEAEVFPESTPPSHPRHQSSDSKSHSVHQQSSVPTSDAAIATRIENQTIFDQDGRVVFRGTVDLRPTLERVASGKHNYHRNDGTTFQNRERKLPPKPSGYYKEYVHPTPNVHGPGPQRVIIGQAGDIWYTPDHYKTFRRIE